MTGHTFEALVPNFKAVYVVEHATATAASRNTGILGGARAIALGSVTATYYFCSAALKSYVTLRKILSLVRVEVLAY